MAGRVLERRMLEEMELHMDENQIIQGVSNSVVRRAVLYSSEDREWALREETWDLNWKGSNV